MNCSLRLKSFKDTLLKCVRADVEKHWRYRGARACVADRLAKDLGLSCVKRYKFSTIPIGLKLGNELVENVRQILSSDLQVPFQPARHCGLRHVCRADICR